MFRTAIITLLLITWLVAWKPCHHISAHSINEPAESNSREFLYSHRELLKQHQHHRARVLPPARRSVQQLDVEHYNLALTIDPINAAVRGRNIITVRALSSLRKLFINLSDALTVDLVMIDDRAINFQHHDDEIWLALSQRLTDQQRFTITIDYHGQPLLDAPLQTGLIFSKRDNRPAIASVSEPYSAPAWWPCVDSAIDKATIEMAVTVPPYLTAISNGHLREQRDNSDGTRTFYWQQDYPIATYLVAVAVADYLQFTDQVDLNSGQSLPLNFYVYPEDLTNAQQQFAVTRAAMLTLTELFGEYPFIKEQYGMVEIPWNGAIEHQTMSGIGAGNLRGNRDITALVVHELAHQWWGDAVSLNNWADIWLNEGLATYSEVLFYEKNFHKQPGDLMRWLDDGRAMGRLAGTVVAEDLDNPFDDVDAVYDKAAWVVHMLRGVMGDENFFRALQSYQREYAYHSAGAIEFQRICESYYGRSLNWFFQQWIYRPYRPIYQFNWQTLLTNNRVVVRVDLEQLPEHSSGKQRRDHYQMPIELRIDYPNGDYEYRVIFNSRRVETFYLDVATMPITVRMDVNNWLLKEVRTDSIQPL